MPCDELLDREKILNEFSNFQIEEEFPEELWANRINIIPQQDFNGLAKKFFDWGKQQETPKNYVISQDGTITSYRQFITRSETIKRRFP